MTDESVAVVIGAGGGIGAALVGALRAGGGYRDVAAFSRSGTPPLDITDEASIRDAAASLAPAAPLLVIDATGFLHDGTHRPEKSWRELDPAQMARAFALNAIGPALLMKHFLPLLPAQGRAVFATLSARVSGHGWPPRTKTRRCLPGPRGGADIRLRMPACARSLPRAG